MNRTATRRYALRLHSEKQKKPEERMFLPVSILSSAQFGLVAVRRRRT